VPNDWMRVPVRGRIEADMFPGRVGECFGRCRSVQDVICSEPRKYCCSLLPSLVCYTICFIITALLLTSPLRAQEKPLEIGVLALGPRNIPHWQCGEPRQTGEERPRETMPFYVLGLLDGLEKLNYVEVGPDGKPKKATSASPGRRFILDLRMGTQQQVRAAAREFVRKKVDIIVAVATLSARIAQEETKGSSIPILLFGVSDPVAEGFVQSLARPGGDITGVSHQLVQGSGKRVELFKEMVPALRHLITFRLAGYSVSEKSMPEVRAAADRFKIETEDWVVNNRDDLQVRLANLRPDPGTGILIAPDSFAITNLDLTLEASLGNRIPAFGLQDYMADWGALAAYGPSAFQAGTRVARYVDRISKGTKPGEIAVEPIDPTFVVNLKAAECLGVSLPLQVLQQADRVIR